MLTIQADTERALLRQCIQYAKVRGCTVKEPEHTPRWLTPKQLATESRLKPSALNKRLKARGCPVFESERGKRRTVAILAHERLLEFLGQPIQPGRKLH
jgi:hypothetical protein